MIQVHLYANGSRCASVEFHCPVEEIKRVDYFEFQEDAMALAFAHFLSLSEQNKGDLVEIVRH